MLQKMFFLMLCLLVAGPILAQDNTVFSSEPDYCTDTSFVYVSNKTGNTEVYWLETLTGEERNLSNNPANDTGPSCSPSGTQVIFVSDRGGHFEIYTTDTSGNTTPQRVTFADVVTTRPQTESLTVGGNVVTFTTEGDPLNLRSWYGTDFNIVAYVPSGTRAQIIDGPKDAGGYRWWKLRVTLNNQTYEGWAVESADGIQTLQPVQ